MAVNRSGEGRGEEGRVREREEGNKRNSDISGSSPNRGWNVVTDDNTIPRVSERREINW